jgi:hypothetical protein
MCASRNREHHIIHTIPCPECGSKVGEPCYWTGKLEQSHGNRLAVHGARRKAWQAAGNPKTERNKNDGYKHIRRSRVANGNTPHQSSCRGM